MKVNLLEEEAFRISRLVDASYSHVPAHLHVASVASLAREAAQVSSSLQTLLHILNSTISALKPLETALQRFPVRRNTKV